MGAVFFAVVKQSSPEKPETTSLLAGQATVKIPGKMTFIVEIANTPLAQTLGLSGRDQLKADKGMLFIFPQQRTQKFWMKDMLFPIDIVWINGDRVIGFSENIQPEPSKNILNFSIYYPPENVNKVLEINAGAVKKYNLWVGDMINLQK